MNNTSIKARIEALEKTLSIVCNAQVEITIRNIGAFTVTAIGSAKSEMQAIKKYLSKTKRMSNWSVIHDEECDATFAYFDLA
jgi:hypothetical protein